MKRRIEDFAILGGEPLFSATRPTGQLDMPDPGSFITKLREIHQHGVLSGNGIMVRRLEEVLKAFHETEHCVAVANAALGITMMLQILGAEGGGEAIMPALAYRGLPHFAKWAGLTPRFADVDPQTHTLDVASVSAQISARAACILAVSSFNTPGHIDELCKVAGDKGIPIFFDSVDAVGATYKGQTVGRFGAAEVFSLHATKLLNGFEGGYITTNDAVLAGILRRQRDLNLAAVGEADVPPHILGIEARLNEVHAAMALLSLERVEGVIERNRTRYDAYDTGLAGVAGISMLPYLDRAHERHNFRMAILEVDSTWPLSRDQTIKVLVAEGSAIRAYYDPPLHRLPPWTTEAVAPPLPITDQLAKRFLHLPVGELVSLADIHSIVGLLRSVSIFGCELARRIGTVN